jgi:hypothetical protein
MSQNIVFYSFLLVCSNCTILYNIILLLVLTISVTLSTTKTYVAYWTSTEYGNHDIAQGYPWSITSYSCYNTVSLLAGSYINGVHTDHFYSMTSVTLSRFTWSSTLMYFSTKKGYTYASGILTYSSTLTISYSPTYTNSKIISITNIKTDIYTMTYSLRDIHYSTITSIIAPSPSILPKNKCTCVFQLCNKINLVLISINIYL